MVFPIYKLSENFEKIPVYEQRRIANLWTAFNHGVESNKAISLDLGGFIEEKVKTVHYSGNIEDEKNLGIHLTNNCLQIKNKLYKEKKESTIAKWDLIEQEIGA